MQTLNQAWQYADQMETMHKEPWMVFKTPEGAQSNQPPFNLFNTGRYATCRAGDFEEHRDEYLNGGAVFVDREGQPLPAVIIEV